MTDSQGWVDRVLAEASEHTAQSLREVFNHTGQAAFPLGWWLTGSAARGSLNRLSDFDLTYCQWICPTKSPRDVLQGWDQHKIRVRQIENPEELLASHDVFGLMSVMSARPLDEMSAQVLAQLQVQIRSAGTKQKKAWLAEIREDHGRREEQFSGHKQLLEPNIKFGPGGLRDALQVLFIAQLSEDTDLETKAQQWLNILDALRFLMANLTRSQVLSADVQMHLAESLQITSSTLMAQVHETLEAVQFHLQLAFCRSSHQRKKALNKVPMPSFFARILRTPNDLELIYELREATWDQPTVQRERLSFFTFKEWNRLTRVHLEALMQAFFFDHLLPDFARLRFYTQFDQYHRFTAGRHIVEVLLAVLQFREKPSLLFTLRGLPAEMQDDDWNVLVMAALFHDIKKGTGGDHSQKAALMIPAYFADLWPEPQCKELAWLCEHHLALTHLAFRKNIEDPEVIQKTIADLQLTACRTRLLLYFSACDIFGSDPASWTEWKSEMLARLHQRLTGHFGEQPRTLDFDLPAWAQGFELSALAELVQLWGKEQMQKELRFSAKLLQKKSGEGPFVRVIPLPRKQSTEKSKIWVRLLHPFDRYGFLTEVLSVFKQMGVSVLEARVQTLPSGVIYDAFLIVVKKSSSRHFPKRFLQGFNREVSSGQTQTASKQILIDEITLSEVTVSSWTVLFRAKDQGGLLLAIAQSLTAQGALILSARVSTWGEMAEDVFIIKPLPEGPTEFLQRLQNAWGRT